MIACQRLLTTVCTLICITSTVYGAIGVASSAGLLAFPSSGPHTDSTAQWKQARPSIQVPVMQSHNDIQVQPKPSQSSPRKRTQLWWTTEEGISQKLSKSTTKAEIHQYTEQGIYIYNELSERDPKSPVWQRLATALKEGFVSPKCFSLVKSFLDMTKLRTEPISKERLLMEVYLILKTSVEKAKTAINQLNTFIVARSLCALKTLQLDDRFFQYVNDIKIPPKEKRQEVAYSHVMSLFKNGRKHVSFKKVIKSIINTLESLKLEGHQAMRAHITPAYHRLAYVVDQVERWLSPAYGQEDLLRNVQWLIFYGEPYNQASI